jgi:hypothetical protein
MRAPFEAWPREAFACFFEWNKIRTFWNRGWMRAVEMRIRRTWPEIDHLFHVEAEGGERIAVITHDKYAPRGSPRWHWAMSGKRRAAAAGFGRCHDIEEVKRRIRESLPEGVAAASRRGGRDCLA